jgi:hypothetical protein
MSSEFDAIPSISQAELVKTGELALIAPRSQAKNAKTPFNIDRR